QQPRSFPFRRRPFQRRQRSYSAPQSPERQQQNQSGYHSAVEDEDDQELDYHHHQHQDFGRLRRRAQGYDEEDEDVDDEDEDEDDDEDLDPREYYRYLPPHFLPYHPHHPPPPHRQPRIRVYPFQPRYQRRRQQPPPPPPHPAAYDDYDMFIPPPPHVAPPPPPPPPHAATHHHHPPAPLSRSGYIPPSFADEWAGGWSSRYQDYQPDIDAAPRSYGYRSRPPSGSLRQPRMYHHPAAAAAEGPPSLGSMGSMAGFR
ncbi:hypothetical protein VTP01DRAFT_3191, partial [Rhizomucor pusillus]|uniref:uncharacterized protein n=1 Tax=Rhizomucor pusillus TaxID=4840 RepID=UPI00374298EB